MSLETAVQQQEGNQKQQTVAELEELRGEVANLTQQVSELTNAKLGVEQDLEEGNRRHLAESESQTTLITSIGKQVEVIK